MLLSLRLLRRRRVLHRQLLRVSRLLLTLFVIGGSLASARDLALVSNKSNPVGTITLPDLVKICKA